MRIRLMRNMARSLIELGRLQEARELVFQAGQLVKPELDPKLASEIWLESGRLALRVGDLDLADRMAGLIDDQGRQLQNTQLAGISLEFSGLAASARGDHPEAARKLLAAADAFGQLGHYRDEYRSLAVLVSLTSLLHGDEDLQALLSRFSSLNRLVADRERTIAREDFEDRLLYVQREAELEAANIRAEADRLRVEDSDRLARFGLGIALISLVAAFGIGTLALLLRRNGIRLALSELRRTQAVMRVSHDLRNPLNGILGLCASLRNAALPAESIRSVEAIESAAHGLATLAQDLLDHGQLEAGKLTLEVRPTDLNQAVRNIARLYGSKARQAGLAFDLQLDEHIPACVQIDPDRLAQVLGNLLGNAIKFTRHGRIGLSTKLLRNEGHNALIEFSVRDTGPGISEDDRARLLQPFQKGGEGRLHASGAGLGLAICDELIRLMGGRLDLESTLGKGSRFTFALPVPVLADPAANEAATCPPSGSSSDAAVRVLVVDDDALNRQYHCILLSALGCEAIPAAEAHEALRAAEAGTFDAALIDFEMEGWNGIDLAAEIRRRSASSGHPVRLFIVSGHPASVAQGVGQLDGWLMKPLAHLALARILGKDIEPSTGVQSEPLNAGPIKGDQAPVAIEGPGR